jgi:transcriptional regulator with XRE-family HTH domain
MNVRKAAAELIRAERKARKLKRAAVAHRCGAVPKWLRRLESGRGGIRLDEFLDLADAIGFNAVEAFRLLAQHRAEGGRGKKKPSRQIAAKDKRPTASDKAAKATGKKRRTLAQQPARKYSRAGAGRTKREAKARYIA